VLLVLLGVAVVCQRQLAGPGSSSLAVPQLDGKR
jgi:hypothetical protein